MNCNTLLASAAALAALAAPATAAAHPSVYSAIAKIAKTPAKQTLTITGTPTGGTFKPSAGATSVPFDATAPAVAVALQNDPAIGYGGVTVSGNAGGPYAVTFVGPQAGIAKTALVPDGSDLTGGTTPDAGATVDQAGGANFTTPSGDPAADQAAMASQEQYVITNDGYTVAYKETNGIGPDIGPGIVTGEGRGMLSLSKVLPSAYRTNLTALQKLAYGPAQTGVQPHATCTGVAALRDPNNIWAWQTRADNDPFFDYIPWQKTTAGLGDEPEKWTATVKTITAGLPGAPAGGVDLAALSSVSDFTAACTALNGTYHAADTASNVTTAVVADAVDAATAPLNDQIGTFTTQIGDLTSQITTLTGTKDTLTAANGKLTSDLATANQALAAAKSQTPAPAPAARKLHLTLSASKLSLSAPTAMLITGVAGQSTTVSLTVSSSVAKALKLKSGTLGKATKKIDDQGAALVTVKISSATAKLLRKAKGTVPVTATATAGSETATAKASVAS